MRFYISRVPLLTCIVKSKKEKKGKMYPYFAGNWVKYDSQKHEEGQLYYIAKNATRTCCKLSILPACQFHQVATSLLINHANPLLANLGSRKRGFWG